MRLTDYPFKFKNATKFGFSPDEVCDWCGQPFLEKPVVNQGLDGFYSVCCSHKHSTLFFKNRGHFIDNFCSKGSFKDKFIKWRTNA